MKNGDMPAMPVDTGQLYEVASGCDADGFTNAALGIKKREYFAVMAMQGMLSNSKTDEFQPASGCHYKFLANLAVKQADALLNALEENHQ